MKRTAKNGSLIDTLDIWVKSGFLCYDSADRISANLPDNLQKATATVFSTCCLLVLRLNPRHSDPVVLYQNLSKLC